MKCDLVRKLISFDDVTIQLDVPASSEAVLDHSLSGQSENPYWGVIWDSAVPMARFLLAQNWSADARAIELGSGLGLTGIAAMYSGLHVQMTDIVPAAVELASHNAALNGFPSYQAEVLDWNDFPVQPYSVILACDVLYERSQHSGLLRFLKSASTPDTEIFIGDPDRQSSRLFFEEAGRAGFEVQVQALTQPGNNPAGQTRQARLHKLRLSSKWP